MKKQSSLLFFALFLLLLLLSFPVAAVDTITLISTDGSGAFHTNPAIYSDRIVWSDDRTGTGFSAVYLYNLTTGNEKRVSYHDGSNQLYPVISGDLIAYADDRDAGSYDIYLYNIRTGQTTQVTDDPNDQSSPAIFGNRIVWMDNRNGTYNIYVNGTSPGTETALSPNLTCTQRFPAISGDLVIWLDDRNDPSGYEDVFMFNLTSGMETPITGFSSAKDFPALYGNRVVWQDYRNGFQEIFMNGTSPGSEQSITPNSSSEHQYPSLYGTKVVWGQNAEGIYLNDTAMSPASIVPVETLPGTNPTSIRISVDPVYGNRVVWEEDSAGKEIYLYSSGGSGTCPAADFSNNFSSGSAPVTVHFTDNSSAGATHWFWDFGDGSNSTLKNPAHTYLQNSSFDVTLTVGNPTCRNANKKTNNVVVGRPVADFIASPTSDIVPAAITFTDTSSGTPTSWLWDFGDLSPPSTEQNPVHTYTAAGTYTISLTATNAHGPDTRTRIDYISILNGVNKIANTTIAGLTITHCGGPQSVTVDAKILPSALIPNSSVLEIQPPSDRGFRNITLYALDGIGFTRVSNTITGNITGVHLETEELTPTGFSTSGGSDSRVNYTVDLSSYPCNASLTTNIWEGAVPDDRNKFQKIAVGSNFAHYVDTAYTTEITKSNFPDGVKAKLHMSVNASWVASVADGRNQTFIQRISDDASIGEVLRTRYLFHDSVNNLDYFEADSPRGLSTFGLSLLSGSGNPFQLITLTVASHLGSGGGGGGGSTPVVVQNNVSSEIKPPTPPDPGKTAPIYSNLQGVITQATTLQSTDGLASVTISEGIVAKDSIGKALSSITIKAIPADSVPAIPAGSAFDFHGMAYEMQPDSATFSPAISISYTVPQARWGQDFLVKTFDTTSGTWQDVPTRYNPNTGVVTARVSHFCCFALFTKAVTPPPSVTPVPVQLAPPQVVAPPSPTAMSIFSGMILWIIDMVTKNIPALAGIVILAAVLFLYDRKRKRDLAMYLL